MPRESASDPVDEANDAATDLLRLYEALGVVALVVTVESETIFVRCQHADHVCPLLKAVLKQYEAPEGAKLN